MRKQAGRESANSESRGTQEICFGHRLDQGSHVGHKGQLVGVVHILDVGHYRMNTKGGAWLTSTRSDREQKRAINCSTGSNGQVVVVDVARCAGHGNQHVEAVRTAVLENDNNGLKRETKSKFQKNNNK